MDLEPWYPEGGSWWERCPTWNAPAPCKVIERAYITHSLDGASSRRCPSTQTLSNDPEFRSSSSPAPNEMRMLTVRDEIIDTDAT